MHRTTTVKLYPTRRQEQDLLACLDYTRMIYNAALEERVGAYGWEGRTVSYYDQQRQITGWSQPYGVCPSRGALRRLDRAFEGFYRRIKQGQTPGFPRFKGKNRWHSIEYPDCGNWILKGNRLKLVSIGEIKYRTGKRGVQGIPKALVVKRQGRNWFADICCEFDMPKPLSKTNQQVGIDLGVTNLIATSDDQLISNERILKRNQDKIVQAQRQVSRCKRGSNRRKKAVVRLQDAYRKTANQRRDLNHKLSRELVNSYDLIVHEDLQIQNMVKKPKPKKNEQGEYELNGAAAKAGLNREILNAGWGQLINMLNYKAEEAGREVIAVNPRHTSQMCFNCKHVDPMNRVREAFTCLSCGHADHADVNAAKNILGLAWPFAKASSVEFTRGARGQLLVANESRSQ